MSGALHSIRVVARRTGLSTHVIRVWEKRYRAVEPTRTATNRRLYSDEEIERLGLLAGLTRGGHTIGLIAQLPTDTLRKLSTEAEVVKEHPKTTPQAGGREIAECLTAVKALDAQALEGVLNRAATGLGLQGLLQRVIAPLAQTLGDCWRDGLITAAHEHFATAVIRSFLTQSVKSYLEGAEAPVLVVATPSGQLHELGALLAAATAANLGWRVTYLGASLPAPEIAGAAMQNRARAVALSLVYPEDDPRLEGELVRLRSLLPSGTALLVGGRAAPAYRHVLDQVSALQIRDLSHLCSMLDDLRKPLKKAA